ncbi:MAG: hypothetical protein ACK2T6_09360 [Anaerolineae bacterium]
MRDLTKPAVFALLIAVPLAVVACRSEPTAPPMSSQIQPVVTAAPLATSTPRPTTEAEATEAARATLAAAPTVEGETPAQEGGPAALPADPDAVVVQLARIEPSAWEPEILEEMGPHFSVQAGGFAVFSHVAGESDTGWYQSVITGTGTADLLALLMDEIDVLGIAARRGEPEARYRMGVDGEPEETGVLGVIYVRSADREGRLVIPEEDMESPAPDDPDAARLTRLHRLVKAVEVWKNGVARDFTPDEKAVLADSLGFWSDLQEPYTPQSAEAYGTASRSRVPSDAPVALWPLQNEDGTPRPIGELVKAGYGETPSQFTLEERDLAPTLNAAHERDVMTVLEGYSGFWGPIWRESGSPDKYLIGLRVGVPGGTKTAIDYEYVLPPRGIGLAVQ